MSKDNIVKMIEVLCSNFPSCPKCSRSLKIILNLDTMLYRGECVNDECIVKNGKVVVDLGKINLNVDEFIGRHRGDVIG